LEKLFNKLKKNQIHPVIAKRVGLGDVADAHVFLEKGKARGPIVCIPWKRSPKLLHENDHIPHEIDTSSPREDTREESPEAEDKKEVQKKRGLFRRRSKGHMDEREEGGEVEDKSKRSKRSKKKEKKQVADV
jgi:hypothetical protein